MLSAINVTQAHIPDGVILSAAVFQAERRACPERAKRVEWDLAHSIELSEPEIPRPAGENAGSSG